jgi:DNA-binding transcriptional LysR family regulator
MEVLNVNLNQLYYFKKLAELKHFTLAAKELFITQPSLSGSISSLEEEVGLELFHRQGRTITLTKYGEQFYKHVSSALNELEKGIEYTKEESGALGGIIDIGCIPTIIGDFLPLAIHNFKSKVNSKTKFNVFNSMSLDIVAGIKSGKYDVGFCSYVDDEPYIEFIPMLTQELILLVNASHPLASQELVSLDDLHDLSLITYRKNIPIGKEIMKLLQPHGLQANHAFDDEITIGGEVCSSDSAAITARTPFLAQFSSLRSIKLDVPPDTRKVYMCYSKLAYHTRPVEIFTEYVITNECKL